MPSPSAPFLSRELNGAVLVEELGDLRDGQVDVRHLHDLVSALPALTGQRVSEAVASLKALAQHRFVGQPALASLLVRWASRLKGEPDVAILVGHLQRLAVCMAVIPALREANERVPRDR